MKKYKVTATAIDRNGVEIDANTAEALGNALGTIYATRAEAQAVADDLADDLPEGYETTMYAVSAA